MTQEILIVGAGIGGLTLAQGLTRRGISARVFERDASPEFRAQGYRVTLQREGMEWLERCLSVEQYTLLLQSSRLWSGANLLNEKLETLADLNNPKNPMRSIDRLTLRRILLSGIEDRVHFGSELKNYEEHSNGVRVNFADGSTREGSVLVGADGHNSRVRRQLLPAHAELLDTQQRDLAGKVPLTAEARQLMRELGVRSISIVTSVEGVAMVLIPQELGTAEPDDASGNTQPQSYLYWGLIAARERYAPAGAPEPSDPRELKQLARELTRTWHPLFAKLIAMTPDNALNLLMFRTSVPHAPWRTGRVTLLGDAVHSMVPMRGAGANSAIYDAGLLTECLSQVARGNALDSALATYEKRMLTHGFGKVRESLKSLDLFVSGSRRKRAVMHGVLGAIQRARSLFGSRLSTVDQV